MVRPRGVGDHTPPHTASFRHDCCCCFCCSFRHSSFELLYTMFVPCARSSLEIMSEYDLPDMLEVVCVDDSWPTGDVECILGSLGNLCRICVARMNFVLLVLFRRVCWPNNSRIPIIMSNRCCCDFFLEVSALPFPTSRAIPRWKAILLREYTKFAERRREKGTVEFWR